MTLMVRQIEIDIWQMHDAGWHVVIPSNMYVKNDGSAVMGRGIALQATKRFPRCALWYGYELTSHVRQTEPGRNPRLEDINPQGLISWNNEWRAIFLPVKTSWNQGARKTLIKASLANLAWLMTRPALQTASVALPRLGCGNGLLDWDTDVKPMVREFLEGLAPEVRERVCIVHPPQDRIEEAPNWT